MLVKKCYCHLEYLSSLGTNQRQLLIQVGAGS